MINKDMAQVILHDYKNNLSLKNKIGRFVWNITFVLLFRPFVSKYLNGWRIFILRIFRAKIGKGCTIAANVKIWAPWNLWMYDYSLIGKNVICYNPNKIIIHSETVISEYVYLCTASHNIYSKEHELITAPITIGGQVWIAVDAFVGMGVIIGEGAVIGARACVFKDVEPWTVVGGNPAKLINKRAIQ